MDEQDYQLIKEIKEVAERAEETIRDLVNAMKNQTEVLEQIANAVANRGN